MSDSRNSTSVGFSGVLTILFIGLKLTNHIDWSWFWVVSPILISYLLVFIITIVMAIFVGIWG